MKLKQRYVELAVILLVGYSLVTLFIELEFTDTDHSTGFFLWSERVVATLFTIEYLVRWIASRKISYPLRPMAVIDLLALLPFYIGFFVDMRTLRIIRAVRVIRLFKLARYSGALQNLGRAFHRVRYEFGIIGFAVFILVWSCSIAIHELERERQPAQFGKLSDSLWYSIVTVTTVGYGDKVPATGGGKIVAVLMMVAGLGLFGTFVSLIGSSFLEEIRRAARPTTVDESGFDPAAILKSIAGGGYTENGETSSKTVDLLARACRKLLERERLSL